MIDGINDQLMALCAHRKNAADPNWSELATVGLQNALEELRVAQEEINASRLAVDAERARYHDLFELAPDGYLVTDVRGQIQDANRAAIMLLNVPDRYVAGKPMVVYIEPCDRGMFFTAIMQLQRDGHGQWTMRLRPRGKAAAVVVEVTASLVPSEDMPTRLIRWTMRDVTQQQRAREQITQNHRRLRELTVLLAMAEERERRRIATGIHDRISQSLAVAKMLTGEIERGASAGQREKLVDLKSVIEQVIDESRTLTFELSPPMLYQLGLGAAVSWLAEQVRRRSGVEVRIEDHVEQPESIPIDLRVLMFQAVRELLANVVKHSRAKRADVKMSVGDGSVHVQVSDSGRGFNAAQTLTPQRAGFGLFNLQTRLEQVGAQFIVESKPKKGTRVTMVTSLAAPVGSETDNGSGVVADRRDGIEQVIDAGGQNVQEVTKHDRADHHSGRSPDRTTGVTTAAGERGELLSDRRGRKRPRRGSHG